MPFNGYYDDEEQLPAPPPSAPPPPGGGPGTAPGVTPGGFSTTPNPGGATTGGGGGGAAPFNLPAFPVFNIPGAPKFNYPVFKAPTMTDAQKEPGYQFRLQSGTNALERSAAAQGRLRTGGTLSDIVEYGQNFGAQEYSNVFNRALQGYDRSYRGAYDAFAPQLQHWQLGAQGSRDATLAGYNAQLQHALRPAPSGPSEPDPLELLGPPPTPPGGGGPSPYDPYDPYTNQNYY